eukprot:966139_1
MHAARRLAQVKLEKEHENQILSIRESYEEKLMEEFTRFDDLRKKMSHQQEISTTTIEERTSKYENEIRTKTALFEAERRSLQSQLDDLSNRADTRTMQFEEIVKEMEEDLANEMDLQRQVLGEKLRCEEQKSSKAQADNSLIIRQYEKSRKTISDLETSNEALKSEVDSLTKQLYNFRRELTSTKNNVRTREKEISFRQRELSKVRNDNISLNNFRAVLDNRITELEEREEPAHKYIHTLVERMESMNTELEERNRQHLELKQSEKEQCEKLASFSSQITTFRMQSSELENEVQHILQDLKEMIEGTPYKQWPIRLIKIYNSYSNQKRRVQSRHTSDSNGADDASLALQASELQWQRRVMEHSMETLRNKIKETEKSNENDKRKHLNESGTLIDRISELSNDNKRLDSEVGKLNENLKRSQKTRKLSRSNTAPEFGIRPRARMGGGHFRDAKTSPAGSRPSTTPTRSRLRTARMKTPGQRKKFDGIGSRITSYAKANRTLVSNSELELRLDQAVSQIEYQKSQIEMLRDNLRQALLE